ncbi:hypothetical protein BpHYR1_007200 [Brachionus plicatilis]|uniref:Uncharacterized protein n=1 Tax=Brachionus plicatilis TaxID=10195 RepID=A0A3M7QXI7_BRAPC|nr:hypothetical protein BpHYR1_007200 [Brachionus plicatilis]
MLSVSISIGVLKLLNTFQGCLKVIKAFMLELNSFLFEIFWAENDAHRENNDEAKTTTVLVPINLIKKPINIDKKNCAINTIELTIAISVPKPLA